jgi:DNA-binding IclR family transcriptional regulator
MSIAVAPAVSASDVSERDNVPSVTKALQLLEAFRSSGPVVGVSEIARLADVPKSTAFRLLAYLEKSGFVDRRGRGYSLGQRLFELGNSVPVCRPHGLRDVAMPHLSDLFVATGSVVHLGVLDGTDVVYLEKLFGRTTLQVPTMVGGRMPASSSALGKAMLAVNGREAIAPVLEKGLSRLTPYSISDPSRFLHQLSKVRAEGVAYDREEVRLGMVCVAAPILSHGRAVAAVSVSSPTTRFNETVVATQVRTAAERISEELGTSAAA